MCLESHWKIQLGKRSGKHVPHKVLRYFPLGPRIKHLFVVKSTDNDVIRHPVDGRAWKEFDKSHSICDIRNVRLGLVADGFNPFGNMSLSYSMWPVVLKTYNLPL